jgi:hypothetical protein
MDVSNGKVFRLLGRFLMLGLLAGGSYLLLLYLCLDTNSSSNNYNAAQIDKLNTWRKTPVPRIIFIGGSNLAFGLDSARLGQELGVHVVNMGHQATFGLRYLMDSVLQLSHPGDCVIMVPEYEHLGQEVYYGGSALIDLAGYTGNWSLLRYNGLAGLLAANTAIRSMQPERIYNPPYSRNSFNRVGDNTAHLTMPAGHVTHYTISTTIDPVPINELTQFGLACKKRNIRLYIGFPASMRSFYELNKDIIVKLTNRLQQARIPLLGQHPEEFVFDDSYFFDTVYHLNAQGRQLRTDRLIALLRSQKDCMPIAQKVNGGSSQ